MNTIRIASTARRRRQRPADPASLLSPFYQSVTDPAAHIADIIVRARQRETVLDAAWTDLLMSANHERFVYELWNAARLRSVGAGDGFELGEDDIRRLMARSGGRCELSGIPFEAGELTMVPRMAFVPRVALVDVRQPARYDNCRLVAACVEHAEKVWGAGVLRHVALTFLHRRLVQPIGFQAAQDSGALPPSAAWRQTVMQGADPGHWLTALHEASVRRAIDRQLAHPLTLKQLQVLALRSGGRCMLTGIPFQLMSRRVRYRLAYDVSLDYIERKAGVSADNSQLVCSAVQFSNRVWGTEALEDVAASFLRKPDDSVVNVAEILEHIRLLVQQDDATELPRINGWQGH